MGSRENPFLRYNGASTNMTRRLERDLMGGIRDVDAMTSHNAAIQTG